MKVVKWILLLLSISALSACHGGESRSSGSGVTTPTASTVSTAVTANTLSNVPLNSSTPVTVAFGVPDGASATALTVTTGLSTLPSGWSAASPTFSCANVNAQTPCDLTLTYDPSTAGTSGTLTLGFTYLDSRGRQQQGRVGISYSSAAPNSVTTSVAPTGPVQGVVGSTSTVSVTFASGDGAPDSNVALVTDQRSLPSGWSVQGSALPCAAVTGTGACQLQLAYAPIAAAASSTLTLAFSYMDDSGAARTGSVAIAYSAVPPAAVTAVATPVSADATFIGSTASVSVAFSVTGGAATNLEITSALPTDWTLASGTLPCAQVGAGTTCQATFNYAPTTTTAASNFLLQYAYTDNGGHPQTGSLTIVYSANSHFAFISNSSANTVSQCEVGVAGQLIDCTQQTSPLFHGPTGMTISSGQLYVTGNPSGTVNKCSLDSTGLSGCTSTGNGMTGPIGLVIKGSMAYVSDQGSGTIFQCSIDPTGDLTGCTGLPVSGAFIGQVAVNGSTLYVLLATQAAILRCAIGASGLVSACVTDSAAVILGALEFNGGFAYATTANNTVLQCMVDNSTGMLSGCVDSGAGPIFNGPLAMTIFGGFAYVVNRGNNTVSQCTVGANGGLSNCADAGASGLSSPFGIAIQ